MGYHKLQRIKNSTLFKGQLRNVWQEHICCSIFTNGKSHLSSSMKQDQKARLFGYSEDKKQRAWTLQQYTHHDMTQKISSALGVVPSEDLWDEKVLMDCNLYHWRKYYHMDEITEVSVTVFPFKYEQMVHPFMTTDISLTF